MATTAQQTLSEITNIAEVQDKAFLIHQHHNRYQIITFEDGSRVLFDAKKNALWECIQPTELYKRDENPEFIAQTPVDDDNMYVMTWKLNGNQSVATYNTLL